MKCFGFIFGMAGIVFGMFTVLSAKADTTYVSGVIETNTTWTKSGSPYVVVGDVYVDSLVTLEIEAGVEVRLDTMKCIIIKGTLNAMGNEADSIIITRNGSARWSRLWFKPGASGNLHYCHIEYAWKSAIFDSLSDSLMIEHNTITNNLAYSEHWWYGGGGICCYYSTPIIRNNTITNNQTNCDGGGIRCHEGSPLIAGNTIIGNLATDYDNEGEGGGIYCPYGSPVITGNTIADNSAIWGGGIVCLSATISDNTINGNVAVTAGGGIHCGSAIISGNIITDNKAAWAGGGIRYTYAAPTIIGNIITDNWAPTGGGIWGAGPPWEAIPRISRNTLSDMSASTIYIFDGVAWIDSNNIYATNYAVYNNGPDTINARYNYWETVSSDTIDLKIWDYYDNSTKGIVYYEPFLMETVEGVEEEIAIQTARLRLNVYPNPFHHKIGIQCVGDREQKISLQIYDLSGRLVGKTDKGIWNARDINGKEVQSGIYFIKARGYKPVRIVKLR